MKRRLLLMLAAIAMTLPALQTAQAEEPVILSVEHGDTLVTMTLDQIKALDQTEVTTSTIWTEGTQEFTGVLLMDLMDHLGVTSGTITATAINDYAIELPVSDAVEDGPIVAYLQNGAPMSVRDKGPLWIVYPYDQNEAYQSEVIYARSIWQLDRMSIEE